MPAQEIDLEDDRWRLEYREMLPVEYWNAQISLLTGFAAASIMLEGKVGILRTLPPAPDWAVTRLRRTARALGIDWPGSQSHPDFIRSLDPSHPAEAAMVVACTSLLRGAGYAAFDGSSPSRPSTRRSPRRTPMSRRRCVDSSTATGSRPVRRCAPANRCREWVRDRLPDLPDIMQKSGRRARAYENAVLNLVEALTLAPLVGEKFQGVVIEHEHDDERKGTVMVREPAVEAPLTSQSPLPVGEEVSVTLRDGRPGHAQGRLHDPVTQTGPWSMASEYFSCRCTGSDATSRAAPADACCR